MPNTPKDTAVNVRLPSDLHDELCESARTNDRSVAAEIRMAVRSWLETNAILRDPSTMSALAEGLADA